MKKLLLLFSFMAIAFISSSQVPELIYYQFDNSGTVVNHASNPVGNNPATMTGLTSATGGFLGSNALSGTGGTGSQML